MTDLIINNVLLNFLRQTLLSLAKNCKIIKDEIINSLLLMSQLVYYLNCQETYTKAYN